jgi:hypothetical protein
LQVGDQLVSSQGVLVPIESISNLNEITTVYNLRVADHHTYFVGGALWGWDVWVHNAEYLKIQKNLSVLTTKVRNELIENPQLLFNTLTKAERSAIIEQPWRMKLFFGTAVQRRVTALKNRDPLLRKLKPTKGNAPQDYILKDGKENCGYDITGNSLSSLRKHYDRPQINSVVVYESIPEDFGYTWKKKLNL